MCSLIYKKLTKNGVEIFKKISNTCHLPKKNVLARCFDSSKTIISHLFWFKRDILDNILTTPRGLAENGLPAKTTQLRHFLIFLLQNYLKASLINTLNNQKEIVIIFIHLFIKIYSIFLFFLPFRWVCPLNTRTHTHSSGHSLSTTCLGVSNDFECPNCFFMKTKLP